MRNKAVEVQPFQFTYRVFNKTTREYSGEFARLIEAVWYINERFTRIRYNQPSISFTLKAEGDFRYENYVGYWPHRRTEYTSVPATPWVIVSEVGVVTEAEIEAAKKAERAPWNNQRYDDREDRYNLKGRRLTRIKGSGEKVKLTCAQVPSRFWGGYSNLVRGYHRGP